MSSSTTPGTSTTVNGSGRGRVLLNLGAVLVVTVWLLYPRGVAPDLLGLIGGLTALAAWVGWAVVPEGRLRTAFLITGAALGAVAVQGTDALLISVVIASIIAFIARPGRPLWEIVTLVAGVAVVISVGTVLGHRDPPFLLSVFGGLLLAVLVGITRRQSRVAETRDRELLARSVEAERESARAALLADRTAVARDIHDVLAHSLGGLVIQLDAVEALLEAGRLDDAAVRVSQARTLASEGLADARRAVSALRDDSPTDVTVVDSALSDLVATHRNLGFDVAVEGELALTGIDPAHRMALSRAIQEALSNARRHAPDASARIRLDRDDRMLTATVTTDLPATPAGVGSGRGLAGMRERFAELGDASTVSAGPVGAEFVVAASVPIAAAR